MQSETGVRTEVGPCPRCGLRGPLKMFAENRHVNGPYCKTRAARNALLARGWGLCPAEAASVLREIGAPIERESTGWVTDTSRRIPTYLQDWTPAWIVKLIEQCSAAGIDWVPVVREAVELERAP